MPLNDGTRRYCWILHAKCYRNDSRIVAVRQQNSQQHEKRLYVKRPECRLVWEVWRRTDEHKSEDRATQSMDTFRLGFAISHITFLE